MGRLFACCYLILLVLFAFSARSQEQPSPRVRNSLSGQVVDAATRSGIAGATVYVHDQKRGTVCDQEGHYHLYNLPHGIHLIEVSHIGFGTLTETVEVTGDVTRNFTLTTSILENSEVIITGVSAATQIRRSPAPVTIVRRAELIRTVSSNLIDALSRKPGISQLSTSPAISKPLI